ncbi:MAG: hypothetical protein AB8I08_18165 [Sandaracinaceae bacterium]
MSRLAPLVLIAVSALGCRQAYPAPAPRTAPRVGASDWGRTDSGDRPAIQAAEQQCLAGLSPRAVSAAFQAVDEVAEALSEVCSIEIVGDDPLLWHVFCGSDATFQSGHYLAPSDPVACDGAQAGTAFDCIGRILSRHLLSSGMRSYVEGVEIVSIGSVDRQRLAAESAFLQQPCPDLQRQLALAEGARWTAPEEAPTDEERGPLWNGRLSWCRAAFAATEVQRAMIANVGAEYELAAIGAGTDWLDDYRRQNPRTCPTDASASGESRPGQCRDARRVDLFIRVAAQQGRESVEPCRAPDGLAGGESGRALYCYSDCQARAAIGRNPEGYAAPRAPSNLLFGPSSSPPNGWIGEASATGEAVNTGGVRQLLLR